MDRNLPVNVNAHSVYLCLKNDHYELVGSTVKIPNSGHSNGPTVVDLTENDPKPKESDIAKPDSGIVRWLSEIIVTKRIKAPIFLCSFFRTF